MSSVPDIDSIGSLTRITDEDAARLVSAEALAELEAAITAIPVAPALVAPAAQSFAAACGGLFSSSPPGSRSPRSC